MEPLQMEMFPGEILALWSTARNSKQIVQLCASHQALGEAGVDQIEHPKHYNKNGLEVIDVIEAFISDIPKAHFHLGNVVKYVLRHQQKNGVEDLKKARWYLDRAISLYEAINSPDPEVSAPVQEDKGGIEYHD